jgi:hypothetical protein
MVSVTGAAVRLRTRTVMRAPVRPKVRPSRFEGAISSGAKKLPTTVASNQ